MKSLVDYLNCGRYVEYSGENVGGLIVTKFSDIESKIIPFFNKYPLKGVKALDFADFIKVVELMKTRAHLTEQGLLEIRKIKSGMNRGR